MSTPHGATPLGPLGYASAALALAVGLWLRLEPVGGALLFGDEFHSLRELGLGYGHLLTVFSPNGSGLALPLLQHVAIDLFGSGIWILRAPAWLPSILALLLIYGLVERRSSPALAVVGLWLFATSPLLVFYGHFARAYSAVVLATALLVFALDRLLDDERPGVGRSVWLAVLGGVMPWLQPLSVAIVAPAFLGAGLAHLLSRDVTPKETFDARTRSLLIAIAGSAGLALALHAPALPSAIAFYTAKTRAHYPGHFTAIDVAALLTGSRVIAWPVSLVVLVALVFAAFTRRGRLLHYVGAAAGPAIALIALRPYGDAYAYARYMIAGIAPALVVLSALAARALREGAEADPARAEPPGRRKAIHFALLVLGPVLGGFVLAIGVLDGRGLVTDPHANAYLSQLRLPAFDESWPDESAFYEEIAGKPGGVRIVELPALVNRARHLYRNGYRTHHAETILALLPVELAWTPKGPYVSAAELSAPDGPVPDADYLILHKDPRLEVATYWRFVYRRFEDPKAEAPDPTSRALMERHARVPGAPPRPSRALRERLAARFGTPVFEDRWIEVFALGGR